MMVKKVLSICIVVLFVLFLFTNTSILPKLELIKKINAMEIFKMFVFPARTLFYLNKIFTGERKEIPLTSSRKGSEDKNNTFKILILSIMTAILIPVSIKLIRPDLMPYPMLVTLCGRGRRSPPDLRINTCENSRTAFGRQNNRRERKSRSYSSVAKADIADDSGSEPEISNKSYLRSYNKQTTNFSQKIVQYTTSCKRLHNSCVNTGRLLFNLKGGSL